MRPPAIGSVGWFDLTVPDAEKLRDFYAAVAGWKPEGCAMGGYEDYTMKDAATGEPRAGVCHARGVNAKMPPCWLLYVVVADLEKAVAEAKARGGAVIDGPRDAGSGHMAVLRDPAGAHFGLWQNK